MAKFLPFVNEKTPLTTVFNKFKTKYSQLSVPGSVQLFRILVVHGVAMAEKFAEDCGDKSDLAVCRHIIRNCPVDPVPSENLHVLKNFLQYCDRYGTMDKFFKKEFISLVQDKEQFLAACPTDESVVISLDLFFSGAYKNALKGIFSDEAENSYIFDSAADLKAYVLFQECLAQQDQNPLPVVKAIMYGGSSDDTYMKADWSKTTSSPATKLSRYQNHILSVTPQVNAVEPCAQEEVSHAESRIFPQSKIEFKHSVNAEEFDSYKEVERFADKTGTTVTINDSNGLYVFKGEVENYELFKQELEKFIGEDN